MGFWNNLWNKIFGNKKKNDGQNISNVSNQNFKKPEDTTEELAYKNILKQQQEESQDKHQKRLFGELKDALYEKSNKTTGQIMQIVEELGVNSQAKFVDPKTLGNAYKQDLDYKNETNMDNAQSKYEEFGNATPLMYAIYANRQDVVEALLKTDGIDLKLTNNKGETALKVAQEEFETAKLNADPGYAIQKDSKYKNTEKSSSNIRKLVETATNEQEGQEYKESHVDKLKLNNDNKNKGPFKG
jgi:hypothetical protein